MRAARAKPSASLLMIANLAKLSCETEHVCGYCTHGSTTRVKKHKVCATKRRRTYCRLNYAIPAPGPFFSNTLTDEEEYIISLCIVAMRIENRLNDPKRPHQSKRSGHACMLPLEFAHTYADYANRHPLPRTRDNLVDRVRDATDPILAELDLTINMLKKVGGRRGRTGGRAPPPTRRPLFGAGA